MTNENPNKKPVPKEKLDPNVAQRQASDPLSSVWVTASAGTGKTKVLTDRVLRLMLGGATPDQILCITFTRAAAALMTNRIREELGQWATCDEAALKEKLTNLSGKKPDAETLTRARQLFAGFLDSHGGMKIQTIHSFSQSLLKRFPIESGIPPYFDVMDDQTAAEMLRESQADLLRDIQRNPHTPLARAVHMITPEISEDDFDGLIGEITYRRGQLLSNIDEHGGLEPTIAAVYDYLRAPRNVEAKTMLAMLNSDDGLNGKAPDILALQDAADILAQGSAAETEKAEVLYQWLQNPAQRVELFPEYKKIFLTLDGEIRKKLTTKATSDAEDILRDEGLRVLEGLEAISTVNVARGTESIMRLTSDILQKYAAKKRALNMLDFDDLVYKANLMMQEDNAAGWVLEKLPGNLKHILVDEAQDTNPDQWQLVGAIVKEFFTSPARTQDSNNTLFVVGDEKQSIFSFQRADPEEFGARKKYFSELVKNNGGTWRDVQMEIAFRSSPAITQAVDAVFANPEASDGLFFKEEQADKKVKHSPFRRGQAGIVELHPVIHADKKEEIAPWSLPLAMEGVSDPATEMADQIADQIKDWLDRGEMLPSRKRKMSPSDIMILVRRRSDFVDHVIRALKKRDIPVAGADRMSLRDQIVVMDLVALGEVLLFPKDDYKLACVLKSPLIGLTDQQLEDLAVTRGSNDLWTALHEKAQDPKAAKIFKETSDYLAALQDDLNSERPYEFYSSVLMNPCPSHQKSGLYAIYSRLGFEAEDPMVEFLNAIERFEQVHIPSLQGFLSWLDAGEAEVKREINLNAETPRVHIMTVHGAKGLEAPVVIMPDTTGIPSDNNRARPKFLWPDAERNVPLWVPRADLENTVFTRERKKAEMELDREYRRLLYVAMTRAADRLYIYGAKNGDRLSEKSWYELIRTGLTDQLGDKLQVIGEDKKTVLHSFNDAAAANDNGAEILRFEVKQTARAQGDHFKSVEQAKTVGVPAWARQAPKADQSPTEKFRPSTVDGPKEVYSAPSPLDGTKETYHSQLGTVIHQLFEYLPSLPENVRSEAAKKYLAKPAWGITAEDQVTTVANIMAILTDPEFGSLFAQNSRPELDIGGLFERAGKKQIMSGQIDRLVVGDKTVTIVDFKNSRKIPRSLAGVQKEYIVQLASYRLALQEIYPDKEIKCALLYTRAAKLMPLPTKKLDEVIAEIGLTPYADRKAPKPKGP